MLLEIASSAAMSGLLAFTFLDKQGMTEASKIQRVAVHAGLTTKEEGKIRTIQLLRRTRQPWGVEYAYRIPLGLCFDDFQRKKQTFEDGLNHKRRLLDITWDDIRSLRIRTDLLEQIKKLFTGTKGSKEIIMSYDGTLKIRIYKEPLPELIPFDDDTLSHCKGWKIHIGQSRETTVYHDFEKIANVVVAGMTRYGKSVFLKNIITTLVHTQPSTVQFTLIDLKGGLAFNRFANMRQVVGVAKDAYESLDALRALQTAMQMRQNEFLSKGFEDVREAGLKQRHFIIIDEAAELASQGEQDKETKRVKAECEHIVSEIARIGGGLGYRLIFATQYPTADTLPRQVKQNCDARLCFRLPTETASRVVLDESGAEELPLIKGRAIYRTDRKQIVQTPYIENGFIDRTIKPHIVIKARKEPTHGDYPRNEAATGRKYTLEFEES